MHLEDFVLARNAFGRGNEDLAAPRISANTT
jgi:hypothetical protein